MATVAARLRHLVARGAGLTLSELVDAIEPDAPRKRRTIIGATLSTLLSRGEITRIEARYYPTSRMIRDAQEGRGRPHAVSRLESGRVYVLGRKLTERQARRLHKMLTEVLSETVSA